MITHDLEVQDTILLYLYEHIEDDMFTLRLSKLPELLREIGNDVSDEVFDRQMLILHRKGLVVFHGVKDENLNWAFDDRALEITGDGCRAAEAALLRRLYGRTM